MDLQITPSTVYGTVNVPPSKSLSHRALICAALASGTSRLDNLGRSRDISATRNCLQALGASFSYEEGSLLVTGCDPAALKKPVTLDANESGSTLRFLIPVAASGQEEVTFLGKPSLLSRPLGIYENIFVEQNLLFEQSGQGLHFHGPLQGGLFTLNGDISSQFISGLLMAAPLLGGLELTILPPYQSRSYVDLTVDMMKKFGVAAEQPTDEAYRIEPDARFESCDVTVESDWSQAAFFMVLAMLKSRLTLKGLAKDSLQGDAIIASMVEQAGGKLIWNDGMLSVLPHLRTPFVFDLANCPDLGPILCTLAAFIPGTSQLVHASRLRYKECDRIAAMEEELGKWGVVISSDEDSITITGKENYSMPHPVEIDGHNDHRIVMAMAVFGLCADTPSIIHGAQAIEKSYPDFFADLAAIHAGIQEVQA